MLGRFFLEAPDLKGIFQLQCCCSLCNKQRGLAEGLVTGDRCGAKGEDMTWLGNGGKKHAPALGEVLVTVLGSRAHIETRGKGRTVLIQTNLINKAVWMPRKEGNGAIMLKKLHPESAGPPNTEAGPDNRKPPCSPSQAS